MPTVHTNHRNHTTTKPKLTKKQKLDSTSVGLHSQADCRVSFLPSRIPPMDWSSKEANFKNPGEYLASVFYSPYTYFGIWCTCYFILIFVKWFPYHSLCYYNFLVWLNPTSHCLFVFFNIYPYASLWWVVKQEADCSAFFRIDVDDDMVPSPLRFFGYGWIIWIASYDWVILGILQIN